MEVVVFILLFIFFCILVGIQRVAFEAMFHELIPGTASFVLFYLRVIFSFFIWERLIQFLLYESLFPFFSLVVGESCVIN